VRRIRNQCEGHLAGKKKENWCCENLEEAGQGPKEYLFEKIWKRSRRILEGARKEKERNALQRGKGNKKVYSKRPEFALAMERARLSSPKRSTTNIWRKPASETGDYQIKKKEACDLTAPTRGKKTSPSSKKKKNQIRNPKNAFVGHKRKRKRKGVEKKAFRYAYELRDKGALL